MNLLPHYQQAINEIEDYFEWANESERDKKEVMKIIDRLAENLARENFKNNDS